MSQRLSERLDIPVAAAPAPEPAGRARGIPWRVLTSPWLSAAGDIAVLFGAFVFAYAVRYVWRVGPELNEFQFTPIDAYWVVAALFIPTTVLSFYILGALPRAPQRGRLGRAAADRGGRADWHGCGRLRVLRFTPVVLLAPDVHVPRRGWRRGHARVAGAASESGSTRAPGRL